MYSIYMAMSSLASVLAGKQKRRCPGIFFQIVDTHTPMLIFIIGSSLASVLAGKQKQEVPRILFVQIVLTQTPISIFIIASSLASVLAVRQADELPRAFVFNCSKTHIKFIMSSKQNMPICVPGFPRFEDLTR